jgi:hypothetical protein
MGLVSMTSDICYERKSIGANGSKIQFVFDFRNVDITTFKYIIKLSLEMPLFNM